MKKIVFYPLPGGKPNPRLPYDLSSLDNRERVSSQQLYGVCNWEAFHMLYPISAPDSIITQSLILFKKNMSTIIKTRDCELSLAKDLRSDVKFAPMQLWLSENAKNKIPEFTKIKDRIDPGTEAHTTFTNLINILQRFVDLPSNDSLEHSIRISFLQASIDLKHRFLQVLIESGCLPSAKDSHLQQIEKMMDEPPTLSNMNIIHGGLTLLIKRSMVTQSQCNDSIIWKPIKDKEDATKEDRGFNTILSILDGEGPILCSAQVGLPFYSKVSTMKTGDNSIDKTSYNNTLYHYKEQDRRTGVEAKSHSILIVGGFRKIVKGTPHEILIYLDPVESSKPEEKRKYYMITYSKFIKYILPTYRIFHDPDHATTNSHYLITAPYPHQKISSNIRRISHEQQLDVTSQPCLSNDKKSPLTSFALSSQGLRRRAAHLETSATMSTTTLSGDEGADANTKKPMKK